MIRDLLPEERVIWRKRFHAQYFDFRGKSLFTRFDGCEFVKCKLLIDQDTEQLAFTGCVFKDCNIDRLEQNEEGGLYDGDNFFDRPLLVGAEIAQALELDLRCLIQQSISLSNRQPDLIRP